MNANHHYATLDPDELKNGSDDAHSTIFIDGKLWVDSTAGRAHRSLLIGKTKASQRLRERVGPELTRDHQTDQPNLYDNSWFRLYDKYLFGRVGNMADRETGQTRRFASFWGRGANCDDPTAQGPADQIPACIQALYYKDLVDDDTIVVYGDGRVALASDLLAGGGPTGEVDQAVVDKTELAKRMHLARGDEKQAIMKQLGVGGGGSGRVEPWDRSLRDRGLLAPGHQHWRMHSEAQDRQLEEALLLLERPSYQECPHCGIKIPDWFHEWYQPGTSLKDPGTEQPAIYRGVKVAADCPKCRKGVALRNVVVAVDPSVPILRRTRAAANNWLRRQRPGEFADIADFLRSGDEAAMPFANYTFREDAL